MQLVCIKMLPLLECSMQACQMQAMRIKILPLLPPCAF